MQNTKNQTPEKKHFKQFPPNVRFRHSFYGTRKKTPMKKNPIISQYIA